jgi:uncharacterized repeat protein (TIGR01451 family)
VAVSASLSQWNFPPKPGKAQLQTNGPYSERSTGDWWTNHNNPEGSKPHVYEIYVPCTVDSTFNIQLDIYDPECFGLGADQDERNGSNWDKATFVLKSPQPDIIVAEKNFLPSMTTSQKWVPFATFNRQTFGCGVYRLEVTTSTDDENAYQLRVRQNDPDGMPLTGDEIYIAALCTSVQSVASTTTRFHFYARSDEPLLLANFDSDRDSLWHYRTAAGVELSGTASGNNEWNGGGTALPPPGGDRYAHPESGWWQAEVQASSGNQFTFYCGRPFMIDTTVAHPQLTVEIDDGVLEARLDTIMTYSLVVHNIGNGPALQVSVTDTLPEGLDLISATAAPQAISTDHRPLLAWNRSTLRPGESMRLELQVQASDLAGSEICHLVQVRYSDVLFTDYQPVTAVDRDTVTTLFQAFGMENGMTPVEISSFAGLSGPGAIHLEWITESETNNLGFNLWRSEYADGDYRKINTSLISGAGDSQQRHVYRFEDREIKRGITYYYKVEDVDLQGVSQMHGPISAVANARPDEFRLEQNYPNPFNSETQIAYTVTELDHISLAVFNLLGQSVRVLVQGLAEPGSHTIRWDGRDEMGMPVQSGTYFYVLQGREQKQVRKMQLIK